MALALILSLALVAGMSILSLDGTLHDCDFNYALGLRAESTAPDHIRDVDPQQLAKRAIHTGEHCFGCTAGSGSSCGGALTHTEG